MLDKNIGLISDSVKRKDLFHTFAKICEMWKLHTSVKVPLKSVGFFWNHESTNIDKKCMGQAVKSSGSYSSSPERYYSPDVTCYLFALTKLLNRMKRAECSRMNRGLNLEHEPENVSCGHFYFNRIPHLSRATPNWNLSWPNCCKLLPLTFFKGVAQCL